MTGEFYDRVAAGIGRFSPEQIAGFRATPGPPDPEARFSQEVRRQISAGDTVLDLGTGDGKWLVQTVAPHVSRAIGIDTGLARLTKAGRLRIVTGLAGAEFVLADAGNIPLPDESVDVAVSRRGPLTADDRFFSEACRVLRRGGLVLEITIGEQNMREVDEVFGRGQMVEDRKAGPRPPALELMYKSHRLAPFIAEDLLTYEYFPGRDSLEYRLLTAPVLEDFDPVSEAALLDEVVARNSTERGIRITFHRLILAAKKPTE